MTTAMGLVAMLASHSKSVILGFDKVAIWVKDMRFLLSIFLLPLGLHALIAQIDEIAEANTYVDACTWVIFDFDDTLVETAQMLGGDPWKRWQVGELEEEGMSREEALCEMRRRWTRINAVTKMKTVEPDTSAFLNDLQARAVTVMVCTHRPDDSSAVTLCQACELGLNFTCTAPVRRRFYLRDGYFYIDGILFCGHQRSKGGALTAFFRRIGRRPKRVIFIDDQMRNVESVADACAALGIEVYSLHYTGAEPFVDAFDPAVAQAQWRAFNEILSDSEARKIADMAN